VTHEYDPASALEVRKRALRAVLRIKAEAR
jgi:hypothetical protein